MEAFDPISEIHLLNCYYRPNLPFINIILFSLEKNFLELFLDLDPALLQFYSSF